MQMVKRMKVTERKMKTRKSWKMLPLEIYRRIKPKLLTGKYSRMIERNSIFFPLLHYFLVVGSNNHSFQGLPQVLRTWGGGGGGGGVKKKK